MPLKVSDGMGAWIKDFQKSDAPQFKGKSDKERRDQAIAAYLSAKRGPQNENYGAMKDAEAHAKRDGKNYNDVSVAHKYDAYHMKKRGYTHFTPSRSGGRTYHKGSAGYDSERIEPHHYSGISESWKTVGRTPDGNYKIQRDTETGARRKVPAQMRNEETPTGKQVKQAIGIARDKRYAKGNMTGAVKTMNKINPKLSNHPRVKDELQKQNEDAFSKDAVETGKVKTGASKSRIRAIQKQDDNRPTLRKNEGKAAKQTHMFNNEKDARAKAKEIGGKYVKGTGRSAGKHAAIKEGKQVNEILPALATVARVAAPAVARAGVKTLGRVATGAARGAAKAVAPAVGAYAAKKVVDKTKNEDKAADRDALQKAMDVFKKRGGKITKVAPGKAAGYHGKDDPGKDVKGMMDRGDTKTMPRKKKVGSMK